MSCAARIFLTFLSWQRDEARGWVTWTCIVAATYFKTKYRKYDEH